MRWESRRCRAAVATAAAVGRACAFHRRDSCLMRPINRGRAPTAAATAAAVARFRRTASSQQMGVVPASAVMRVTICVGSCAMLPCRRKREREREKQPVCVEKCWRSWRERPPSISPFVVPLLSVYFYRVRLPRPVVFGHSDLRRDGSFVTASTGWLLVCLVAWREQPQDQERTHKRKAEDRRDLAPVWRPFPHSTQLLPQRSEARSRLCERGGCCVRGLARARTRA